MKEYKRLMEAAYGEEGRIECLLPQKGLILPDADEFFDVLLSMFGSPTCYAFTADTIYSYHNVDGMAYSAWGHLYIAIPEYDVYERHEGKWAVPTTLMEAVEQTVHLGWRQEEQTKETQRDIDNYLEKL